MPNAQDNCINNTEAATEPPARKDFENYLDVIETPKLWDYGVVSISQKDSEF